MIDQKLLNLVAHQLETRGQVHITPLELRLLKNMIELGPMTSLEAAAELDMEQRNASKLLQQMWVKRLLERTGVKKTGDKLTYTYTLTEV